MEKLGGSEGRASGALCEVNGMFVWARLIGGVRRTLTCVCLRRVDLGFIVVDNGGFATITGDKDNRAKNRCEVFQRALSKRQPL